MYLKTYVGILHDDGIVFAKKEKRVITLEGSKNNPRQSNIMKKQLHEFAPKLYIE